MNDRFVRTLATLGAFALLSTGASANEPATNEAATNAPPVAADIALPTPTATPTAAAKAPSTPPKPAAPTPVTISPDELRAFASRLDALQQQNAAQQSEIDRLRDQLGRVGGDAAMPVEPRASGSTNASSSGVPSDAASVAAGAPDPHAAIRSAPKSRSVDTIYQQQNAAFTPKLTLTPSITSTYSDNRFFTLNGFLALNAIFLGNVNVTQQKSDVRIFDLDATYGVSPRLQFEANVPYYMRESNFSTVGANFAGQVPSEDRVVSGGVGDVQVGAYYQVHHENASSPGITLNAHASVPTGRHPYGIPLKEDASNTNLLYPIYLPTGSGVVGYEVGASFVKTSDPAIFFGGLNYYLQTQSHFDNLQFTFPGNKTPGSAQPGDAIQFQIGTAFALNDKASLSFAFIETATNASRVRPDRGQWSSIVGSATKSSVLDISAGFASNPHQTLITNLQLGLTQDAPNFQLGFRFPTRF